MPSLFMVLIGCRPEGRFTEQHDIFFGIADAIEELIPAIVDYWPEAKGKMHLDGWRKVTCVDNFAVSVANRNDQSAPNAAQLFFINLGGYKPGELEEYHYKMLVVAADKNSAIRQSKQTAFFKHAGFGKKAAAHIDDKYGVDVDDIFNIKDILPADVRSRFQLHLTPLTGDAVEDELHLGYYPLSSFE